MKFSFLLTLIMLHICIWNHASDAFSMDDMSQKATKYSTDRRYWDSSMNDLLAVSLSLPMQNLFKVKASLGGSLYQPKNDLLNYDKFNVIFSLSERGNANAFLFAQKFLPSSFLKGSSLAYGIDLRDNGMVYKALLSLPF